MNKTAAAVAQDLNTLQAGLRRAAELITAQQSSQPSEDKLASVNTERDELVAKMANAGLIDPASSQEVRETFDKLGGAEHLISQLIDAHTATSQADQVSGQLGQAAPGKTASAPSGDGKVRNARFQSPYRA